MLHGFMLIGMSAEKSVSAGKKMVTILWKYEKNGRKI